MLSNKCYETLSQVNRKGLYYFLSSEILQLYYFSEDFVFLHRTRITHLQENNKYIKIVFRVYFCLEDIEDKVKEK